MMAPLRGAFAVVALLAALLLAAPAQAQTAGVLRPGCGVATVTNPNVDTGTLLGAYGTLMALGTTYGIDGTCLSGASDKLSSCLTDLLALDGCCSSLCYTALQVPLFVNPDGTPSDCLNSLIKGVCQMAAANIDSITGLITPLFSVGSRCILGTYYTCDTYGQPSMTPSPEKSPAPVNYPSPMATPSPVASPQPMASPEPMESPVPSASPAPLPSPGAFPFYPDVAYRVAIADKFSSSITAESAMMLAESFRQLSRKLKKAPTLGFSVLQQHNNAGMFTDNVTSGQCFGGCDAPPFGEYLGHIAMIADFKTFEETIGFLADPAIVALGGVLPSDQQLAGSLTTVNSIPIGFTGQKVKSDKHKYISRTLIATKLTNTSAEFIAGLDAAMTAFVNMADVKMGLLAYSYGAVLPVVAQLCGPPCDPVAGDYLITLDYFDYNAYTTAMAAASSFLDPLLAQYFSAAIITTGYLNSF